MLEKRLFELHNPQEIFVPNCDRERKEVYLSGRPPWKWLLTAGLMVFRCRVFVDDDLIQTGAK